MNDIYAGNVVGGYSEGAKVAALGSAQGNLKASQLPLTQLEKNIGALHDTITQLEERIRPVLTPPANPENDSNSTETVRPAERSPLSEQLAANNYRISTAIKRLHKLMDKLEC